jgi:hypothetical protein
MSTPTTPTVGTSSNPAVPLPPSDILAGIGAGLVGGLNRWMDVEVYRRTGGALLPGGQVAPGVYPPATATPTVTAASMSPLLLLIGAGLVVLLLVRK